MSRCRLSEQVRIPRLMLLWPESCRILFAGFGLRRALSAPFVQSVGVSSRDERRPCTRRHSNQMTEDLRAIPQRISVLLDFWLLWRRLCLNADKARKTALGLAALRRLFAEFDPPSRPLFLRCPELRPSRSLCRCNPLSASSGNLAPSSDLSLSLRWFRPCT
jgi:hypothetical protein